MTSTVIITFQKKTDYKQAVYLRSFDSGSLFEKPIRLFPATFNFWNCILTLPKDVEFKYFFYVGAWDDENHIIFKDSMFHHLTVNELSKSYLAVSHEPSKPKIIKDSPFNFLIPMRFTFLHKVNFGDSVWIVFRSENTKVLPPLRLNWQEGKWTSEIELPDSSIMSMIPALIFEVHFAQTVGFVYEKRRMISSYSIEIPSMFIYYQANFESEKKLARFKCLFEPKDLVPKTFSGFKSLLDNTINIKKKIFSYHPELIVDETNPLILINLITNQLKINEYYFDSIFEAFQENGDHFRVQPVCESEETSTSKPEEGTWNVNNLKDGENSIKISLPAKDSAFEVSSDSRELKLEFIGLGENRQAFCSPEKRLRLKVKDFDFIIEAEKSTAVAFWADLGFLVSLEKGETVTVKYV